MDPQQSAFDAALEADFPLDIFAPSSFSFEDSFHSSPTPPPFMPQQQFDFTSLLTGDAFLEQPFNYTYPSQSLPAAPSQSQLKPTTQGHSRNTSKSSVYSDVSVPVSLPETVNTAFTTPPPAPARERSSTPARAPGPLLLPKIRTQDQDVGVNSSKRPLKRSASALTSATPPPPPKKLQQRSNKEASTYRPVKHARSFTSPDMMSSMAYAHMSFSGLATPSPSPEDQVPQNKPLLLCTPAGFAQDSYNMTPPPAPVSRRASSCGVDTSVIEKYGYPAYRQVPFLGTPQPEYQPVSQQSFTPEPTPAPASAVMAATLSASGSASSTTTLINYLTTPNPAATLVRTLTLPHRDPAAKHFWWDIRSLSTWSSFTYNSILSLPSASSLLTTPIPSSYLPSSTTLSSRDPETEASLHSIYASHYLPKLNAALASTSSNPLKFSIPTQNPSQELLYIANLANEKASAAAIFGGKQSARIVGLVRAFDGFNTGMRHNGAIEQVKYLRSLAALQFHMREHSTRYGFILTEVELVLVRLGTSPTPLFGEIQVTSIALNESSSTSSDSLTACLALWGLAQLASMDDAAGVPAEHVHWYAEIGAPADCTRRMAVAKEGWIPKPQTVETREAKRNRGWCWPEDPIGKKEVGKRGVKYGGV